MLYSKRGTTSILSKLSKAAYLTSIVLCGLSCSGPYDLDVSNKMPQGPTAISLSDKAIVIQWWGDFSRQDTFEVQRSVDNDAFLTIGSLIYPSTSIKDSSLLRSSSYVYRVRSRSGRPSAWSTSLKLVFGATNERLATFSNLGRVNAIAISSDSRFIVTGGTNAKIWKKDNLVLVRTLPNPYSKVIRDFALHLNDRFIVFCVDDNIILQNLNDGLILNSTKDSTDVHTLAFTSDAQTILSGDNRSQLRVWQTDNLSLIKSVSVGISPPSDMAISTDGQMIAVLFYSFTQLRNSEDWTLLRTISDQIDLHSVCFSSDGRTLVLGRGDGVAAIWSTIAWNRIVNLASTSGAVTAAVFSPADTLLITGHDSGKIIQWRTIDWSPVRVLASNKGQISSIAFSKDGEFFVSSDLEGNVNVWSKNLIDAWHTTQP